MSKISVNTVKIFPMYMMTTVRRTTTCDDQMIVAMVSADDRLIFSSSRNQRSSLTTFKDKARSFMNITCWIFCFNPLIFTVRLLHAFNRGQVCIVFRRMATKWGESQCSRAATKETFSLLYRRWCLPYLRHSKQQLVSDLFKLGFFYVINL